MRKRLFIFAAATCFALSAFAAPAFAEEPSLPDEPTISSEASGGSEDALHNGSDDGPTDDSSTVGGEQEKDNGNATPGASHDPVVGGSAGSAMTLAGTIAGQNVQAWINSNPASPSGSATFALNGDFTTDQGLLFTGDSTASADSRQTFIIDAQSHNITLNDYGIGATYCNVIIKDCPNLTINASKNPGASAGIAACYFGHATLTLDNCTNVTITNNLPEGEGGSGICVYNEGSLYFQNYTNVTISRYMFSRVVDRDRVGASGIYMDCEKGYTAPIGSINVTDHSTLTATHCFHNGITANPANINVMGSSVLKTYDNNTAESDGRGGLGCYFGKLTVTDHSSVISTGNTGWRYGIFVGGLEVDGTSEVNASNNGSLYPYDLGNQYDDFWDGTGLAISGDAVLHPGAKVTANNNWGIGVMLYSTDYDPDHPENYYPGGPLTIESGATLTACNNANYGMANACTLTVKSGAHVHIKENLKGGLDNYPNATTIVEKDADFVISNNFGRGIKNGNADPDQVDRPANLVINSGVIKENHTEGKMPSFPNIDLSKFPDDYIYWGGDFYNIGGGIYNECGTVSLSTAAKVYNNHAKDAGDDLYNNDVEGNSFNISALEPGAKWSVLDDDGKIIDDWYNDDAGKENRWTETNAKNNTVTDLPRGAALKAAHGINAPTPSPKPVEPTAAPTEAPTPTAVPTTVPTAAPTAAPTTAPADNTATAAPATPAPTARPTVTATPAPTAQASGVIPQTGDSSSPALFSILTLGSITALCVLQKRRKSK